MAAARCWRLLIDAWSPTWSTWRGHQSGPSTFEIITTLLVDILTPRNKLPRGSICSPDERLCFIQAAVQDARDAGLRSATLKQPPAFFNEEFQWIQRQGIGNKQDYVDVERTGRSTRVRKAERADVFDLYKRYLGRRGQAGKRYDWDDLASAVRRELGDDGRQRFYSHVVIDEGQDFSPEMLRSLAAAIPCDGSLTFFGDIAQQIYGHRMSWRNAGLNARRLWRFQENYRNTKQIAQLALALAAMPHFPDDPDLVEPTAPAADGPRPVLVQQPSELAECQLVVSRAIDFARTGTVAILLRTRDQEPTVQQFLPSEATRLHRNLSVCRTDRVCSTARIMRPRGWSSTRCLCRFCPTSAGHIHPTSRCWAGKNLRAAIPVSCTSGSRVPGRPWC